MTIELPSLTDAAAAPTVVSVSIDKLKPILDNELRDAQGGTAACRSSPAITSALESSLVHTTDDQHLRKAAVSPLFLAAAMFRPQLRSGSIQGLHIAITKSTLPVAAGLGSSAALSTAASASLLDCWCRHPACGALGEGGLLSLPPAHPSSTGAPQAGADAVPPASALQAVNEWAYASECLFHGSPSGLDNTVSCLGGALTYSRTPGQAQVHVAPMPGLPPLRLLVANTKVPKETGKLVAGVRALHDAYPAVIKPIIAAIQAIADEVLALVQARARAGDGEADGTSGASAAPAATSSPALTESEYSTLCRLAKINHGLLNAVGVGHPALDAVCQAAASHGWAGKLTGAGGGGCAIVLLPPACPPGSPHAELQELAVTELKATLAGRLACDVFETTLGGRGLLLHR